MAEGSEDNLEVELSFPTGEAVRNAQAFAAATVDTAGKLDKLDVSSRKAEGSIRAVGEASAGTAKATRGVATEVDKSTDSLAQYREEFSKQISEAKRSLDVTKQQRDAFREQQKAAADARSEIPGFISAYLGFAGVQKILEAISTRLKDIREATADLVGGRQQLDNSVRSLAFNLGMNADEAGLARSRQILGNVTKLAPAATTDQVAGAIGSAASFGLTPEKGQDLQVIGMVTRVASVMELNKQTTGDLVKFLAAMNALTPQSADRVLAKFIAAAKTTPVENQAEFAQAYFRAVIPMVKQGMTLESASGQLSGAAVGEPSATIAATRTQQVTGIIGGKTDDAAAALFDRARKAGLLSASTVKALDDAQRELMGAMSPEQRNRFDAVTRDLAALDASAAREETAFRRDIQAAERDATTARQKGRDVRDIQDRIARRKESHESEVQSIANRRATATASLGDVTGDATRRAQATAYRGMSLEERSRIFYSLAAGSRNPQELNSLLDAAGATPEEKSNVAGLISSAGQSQAKATAAAVAGAAPGAVAQMAGGFESSDIGRRQAAETRTMLSAAETVTSGQQYAEQFAGEAATATKVRLADTSQSQSKLTVRLPFSGRSFTAIAATKGFYNALVAADLLLSKMFAWYSVLSDEEKQFAISLKWLDWFRNAERIVESYNTNIADLIWTTGFERRIHELSVGFGDIQRAMVERRNRGKARDTGNNRPAGAGGGAGATAGGSPRASAAGAGGPMEIGEEVASAGVGAGPGVASAGAGGSRVVYNLSIGTLVSQGGNELDFVGALEAEA